MHPRIFHLFLLLIIINCNPTQSTQTNNADKLLWTADWSPNEKYIAIGGNHKTLKILDGKNYSVIQNIPYENTITKVKWHPFDENVLAVATQISKQKVGIYNIETRKNIQLDSVSEVGARGLGWSPNGEFLAVGDNDGFIRIFNKNGQYISGIDCKQKVITGLSWHPTQPKIVTVGKQIAIYDINKQLLLTIVPRPVEVLMLSVAWHPSGAFFVTGDYGDYIKHYPALLQFWSADGKNIRNIKQSNAEYRNLTWSSDGERLITASDGLRIWSKDGKLLKHSPTKSLLWGIDWNADYSKIIASDMHGKITIWNSKGKKLKSIQF